MTAAHGAPLAEASNMTRRRIIQTAAVATAGLVIDPALRAAVYAQGSDKPEKEEVRIGFIPLTDCASVVMASVLGLRNSLPTMVLQALAWLALLLPAYQYARPDGTWAETIIRRREPYLAGVAALMRRSNYLRVRYREDVPCLEDNDLWHRASLLGLRFVDVPEAVYRVHRRAGSRRLTKGRGVVRVQMESEARRWACSTS